MRSQIARCRSIQPTASASASRSRPSRWVRPSIVRTTTPAYSGTFTGLEIVGFDTPKPPVASPIVAGPRPRRSTIPRRIGCRGPEGIVSYRANYRSTDPSPTLSLSLEVLETVTGGGVGDGHGLVGARGTATRGGPRADRPTG